MAHQRATIKGFRDFSLIAQTPPWLFDPSIAIAAGRAGDPGILDLEYCGDGRQALRAVHALVRHGAYPCGIRISGDAGELVERVLPALAPPVGVVIVSPVDHARLPSLIEKLNGRDLAVLLEATCLDEALLAQSLRVAGVIAKGHEAGGRVGDETTFILLQRLLARIDLPVFAHGGIGCHTAAASYTAGAAGVVLDTQLLLTRESHISEPLKAAVSRLDGSEPVAMRVRGSTGEAYRVWAPPGSSAVAELSRSAGGMEGDAPLSPDARAAWRGEIAARIGGEAMDRWLFPLGQDVAFAAPLARRFGTVAGVLRGVRDAVGSHLRTAKRLQPLAEGAPLAAAHGTRFPIVQGPMARVSDLAPFAACVAQHGALPFVAVSTSSSARIKPLLEDTRRLLRDRPWGVGLLGFIDPELFHEQLRVIRAYRPPFALLAGGRPDQVRLLEREGIRTYAHVASPALLRLFLQQGARGFVFEGRECGGHVGPRSSFVLWDSMINTLLDSLKGIKGEECQVLFAGGIHDGLSASMVAALAAPLAERGVPFGVLLGTAYLFTEEAVHTGAIIPRFHSEAIRCSGTVVLEASPGHASRCAESPFTAFFEEEKRRLTEGGLALEEIRARLEELCLGRLGMAAKGTRTVSEEEQYAQGMYMIGQAASLRDRSCSMAGLHSEISSGGAERLAAVAAPEISNSEGAGAFGARGTGGRPCDIAIIGMACLLPKAGSIESYWENILNRVNAITEIPQSRWDWRLYYSRDPKEKDRIYSKWGGFIDPIVFEPTSYGMPPNELHSIEPLHLLTLETVRKALDDAGYARRPYPGERTSVILGTGGSSGELGQQYGFRSTLPMFIDDPGPEVWERLPQWTTDTFAGILPNVAAGRIANRFDLGGMSCTVDAACASSLAALYLAVGELERGAGDMVIVGGAETVQNPFSYFCFSSSQVLSPGGQCRTFDESADGIVTSEGVVVLVLKRLADARRDGDRIYAVIKAVSGSSDGKGKCLTATHPAGQRKVLERAYARAGFPPATVELMEAHGTGTAAGDRAEVEALKAVFEAAGAAPPACAIGSVKSMIGHAKCAAGMAGLAKAALALYHKVLPPTLGIDKPNPVLSSSPFYINKEPRPWIHGTEDHPRRAGVSAFGFGGTNFHAVLEEHADSGSGFPPPMASSHWPAELFLWKGESAHEIAVRVDGLAAQLAGGAAPALRDLSYTLWEDSKARSGHALLALVAASLDELREKLIGAGTALKAGGGSPDGGPDGIVPGTGPAFPDGKIAFLFPGQGSQYPGMLKDLALHFSEVRESFEHADRALEQRFPGRLSGYVFPPSCFSLREELLRKEALERTNVAQPALGACGMGLFKLLKSVGLEPHMAAGHSYGELLALCASGVLREADLYPLSELRGRLVMECSGDDPGCMAAVRAGAVEIQGLLEGLEGVWIANLNAPDQTVISGTKAGVEAACRRLKGSGMEVHPLPVSCAFHSPMVEKARQKLAEHLASIHFAAPAIPVYSNDAAAQYPGEPEGVREILSRHMVRPVRFMDEITAMYEAGARIFIEVGPRAVLTNLAHRVLGSRPHLALPMDDPGRSALVQLLHVLRQLLVHGIPLHLDRLYEGRRVKYLELERLVEETKSPQPTPTAWLVDGGRARPLGQAGAGRSGADTWRGSPGCDAMEGLPMEPVPSGAPPLEPASAHGLHEAMRSGAGEDTVDALMARHQALMKQYLETMSRFAERQQQIMLAYLSHGAKHEGPPGSVDGAAPGEPPSICDSPRLPVSCPASEASSREGPRAREDGENDRANSTASDAPMGKDLLMERFLGIVSERTGYPTDMLDPDLNLEADLSIDSIKRIEILLALEQQCFPGTQGAGESIVDALAGAATPRAIVDALSGLVSMQGSWDGKSGTGEYKTSDVTPRSEGGEVGSPGAGSPELNRSGYDSGAFTAEETGREAIRLSAAGTSAPAADGALRFVPVLIEAPLESKPFEAATDSVALITDDEGGIADAVSRELRRMGLRTALVRMGRVVAETADGVYEADLTDSASVREMSERIRRRQGAVSMLVHLLPLRIGGDVETMSLARWQARLGEEVKSLFHLARAVGADLTSPAFAGKSHVVTAMAVSAAPADGCSRDIPTAPLFPCHGGLAGLVKTLAQEWPSVGCKVVGLEHVNGTTPAAVASALLRELASEDSSVEVHYGKSVRLIPKLRLAPLSAEGPVGMDIDKDWVILVTGGARGITAEIARELAARYQPTLLIVGRSHLPPEEEASETEALTSPGEIKRFLIDRMRRMSSHASPSMVESASARILKNREIRKNLASMRQAGARVHYFRADVSDTSAFTALLDEIYLSFGRLDGVIHGAGIIEDRLLMEKEPSGFDRVFDTKVNGALALGRRLEPDSLKLLVFFSSIAGRFGNRGQADYAAANQVLSNLAVHLGRRWPGRVLAIDWGPWENAGMVSEEQRRIFMERGIGLISPGTGRRLFDAELRWGLKTESQVIWGDGPWERVESGTAVSSPGACPRMVPEHLLVIPANAGIQETCGSLDSGLPRNDAPELCRESLPGSEADGKPGGQEPEGAHAPAESGPDWDRELFLRLDAGRDRYLLDHQLDGKPVLPAAMAVEMMAEAAEDCLPGCEVLEIRSMRVLRGIVVDGPPREMVVRVRPGVCPKMVSEHLRVIPAKAGIQETCGPLDSGLRRNDTPEPFSDRRLGKGLRPEDETREATVEIGESFRQTCYRATVLLGCGRSPCCRAGSLPAPLPYPAADFTHLEPFPLSVEEAYSRWLFHGPSFQGIRAIQGMSDKAICGLLTPSVPSRFFVQPPRDRFAQPPRDRWIVDPLLLDCGLQLAILWGRARHGVMLLPVSFDSFRRYGVAPSPAPGSFSGSSNSSMDSESRPSVRCCLRVRSWTGGRRLLADIYFLDGEERLLSVAEKVEFAGGMELNRLTGRDLATPEAP